MSVFHYSICPRKTGPEERKIWVTNFKALNPIFAAPWGWNRKISLTLAERRAKLCLKFAKKSLKIENFRHLFPKNSKEHEMRTRKSDFFKICNISGQRYLKSAIPSMQRMLNRDIRDQQESLKRLTKVSVTNKLCLW